jgi:hypothetical protein
MSSFKLEKGGSAKSQAKSIGGLMVVFGILGGIFVSATMFWLLLLGIVLVVAGASASE